MSEQKTQVQVIYSGTVQKVGFRASVTRIACGYEVTGWIRNLPDGRVQMIAQGQQTEVNGFLKAIQESHLKTFIHHIDVSWQQPDTLYKGFSIIH